ncbi:conserved hypothetical protein [Frankia sp. AiPs1]|uniref:hypothetical protein n=1 Tax=Frankia sp. AiPa1 TaxID=573492 RepID=UPI00202B8F9A|nr:hypothetical protein [Frankia sp. AiPa1]MCL9759927.1 hypothetical protein [Frankia sp. AiPa1]
MDINPPWSRGAAPVDIVTFLCRSDGAAISVGRPPASHPGSAAGLVALGVRLPGTFSAALQLAPDEAMRLSGLLVEALESGAEAFGGPLAASPRHGVSAPPPGDASADATVGAHDHGPASSRFVIIAPEGVAVAEVWQALAALPVGARLVDFSSDADVVLVFALDDPRWPVRSGPASAQEEPGA